jgi:hypothetical protein
MLFGAKFLELLPKHFIPLFWKLVISTPFILNICISSMNRSISQVCLVDSSVWKIKIIIVFTFPLLVGSLFPIFRIWFSWSAFDNKFIVKFLLFCNRRLNLLRVIEVWNVVIIVSKRTPSYITLENLLIFRILIWFLILFISLLLIISIFILLLFFRIKLVLHHQFILQSLIFLKNCFFLCFLSSIIILINLGSLGRPVDSKSCFLWVSQSRARHWTFVFH